MLKQLAGPALAAAFTMALGLGPARAADPLTFLTLDYAPYAFEENGAVKGIAVDLVVAALKRDGKTATIRVQPWARVLEVVKNAEREQFLDYGREPLVDQDIVLFVPADSKLTFDGDLTKLAEVPIGMVNQVSYGAKFDTAVKDGTLKKLEIANRGDLNALKLVNGRLDAMVSNRYVGLWGLKKADGLAKVRELQPPVEKLVSYAAFSKKRDLGATRDALDVALKAMKADGSYAAIVATYTQ